MCDTFPLIDRPALHETYICPLMYLDYCNVPPVFPLLSMYYVLLHLDYYNVTPAPAPAPAPADSNVAEDVIKIPCTQYTLHCTFYTLHCIRFALHCKMCTVYITLCTAHCAHCTVHSLQCIVNGTQYTLSTLLIEVTCDDGGRICVLTYHISQNRRVQYRQVQCSVV